MASEFFQKFGRDATVTIFPSGQGIIEVFLDGERIFDKKAEGNVIPNLSRVRKMQEVIGEKIKRAEGVAADNN